MRRKKSQKLRKKKATTINFINVSEIGRTAVEEAPPIFTPPFFKPTLKNEGVEKFISDFWKWNEGVLGFVNEVSHIYIDMQEQLANLVHDHVGESLVDLGAGRGDFCVRLLQQNGKKVRRIFAVDIDYVSLEHAPHLLSEIGYKHRLALVQTSTMYEMPIWDESVDCVVSSLGGLMYAGWWFENDKLICEGPEALVKCLQDIHRILKPGGVLAFSCPRPIPDWNKIRKESVNWLLKESLSLSNWSVKKKRLGQLWKGITYGKQAEALSAFMHEVEQEGHAFYLPPKYEESLGEEYKTHNWECYLNLVGFDLIKSSIGECYAGQGVLCLARKT